jgi:hypothetical protein
MTPAEEGAQAAREGKTPINNPYSLSNKALPVHVYIRDGWEEKRSAWYAGWCSVSNSHGSYSSETE